MAKRYLVLAQSWGSDPTYKRGDIVAVPRDATFHYDIATAVANGWISYIDGSEDAVATTSPVGRASKTVTFTGAAGAGAVGPVAIATVTGRVVILGVFAECTTPLASGGAATVALGTAGAHGIVIAATAFSLLEANKLWMANFAAQDPAAGIGALVTGWDASQGVLLQDVAVILTVAAAAVTAGVITFTILWVPLNAAGAVV